MFTVGKKKERGGKEKVDSYRNLPEPFFCLHLMFLFKLKDIFLILTDVMFVFFPFQEFTCLVVSQKTK